MSELEKVRHVCGISGGKDSAALAIYLKDVRKLQHVEYFFSDTGKELPEVYDFLDRMEAYLGQEIVRIGANKTFEHFLKLYGNFLPSPRQRWCTRELKIKPFEKWIGDVPAISYVAIRADEPAREGYISTKPNIQAVLPFREDGITKADVFRILEESVGVPSYYSWRSRSGCYFCFFQQRGEWQNLKRVHPELFEAAKEFEKADSLTGKTYTWIQGLPLAELEKQKQRPFAGALSKIGPYTWQEQLAGDSVRRPDVDNPGESKEDSDGCLICHL
jgi:3'-phosphoadenosine 5'-phosphosulfate sulfotransferase (PAPS reductase)/FAD synthetase